MRLAAEYRRALGEAGHHLPVADHQFARVKPKRAPSQVAAGEVVEDLIDAGVEAGDRILSWYMPADLVAKQRAELVLATTA